MMNSDKTNTTKQTPLGFMLSHLRKHWLSLTAGFLVLIAVDGIQLIIPRIIQRILDVVADETFTVDTVAKSALTIFGLAFLMLILRFFWRYLIVRPSRVIEQSMRNSMFEKLLRLSSSYFNKTKVGDLMALFINDLNAIRMAIGMGLIGFFDAIFLSTMSLLFMLSISPELTMYTVLPLPLIIFIFIKTSKTIQNRYTDVQTAFDSISSHTQESLSGIRVIKGFVQEKMERDRLYGACDSYVDKNIRLVKIWGILFPSITMLASSSMVLLICIGSSFVMNNKLTIGQFVSFTFYINLMVWPMIATGWVFNLMQKGIASSKRVLELLNTMSDVSDSAVKPETRVINGGIEFRNCTFRYAVDSRDVLKAVSCTIPQGGSLGIIGRPGSGKTTLVSLLCHVYKVERGQIFIDGIDISDIPLATLRMSISYVPQDSFLFSDTIAANIGFSRDGVIDTNAIERVAKIACVHDDILEFTDGYTTKIGERGITLSGGQKQRIAIARALLADSSILILDDSLSAVDPVTESKIKMNLRPEIKKKTSLIIAHRVSTIRDCDQIIVLSDGQIAEHGTHEQLVEKNGFYARLYELQSMQEES
jgi:ATP-binding cassette subfamily B protein